MSESAPPEDPYEGIDGIELNSFLTTPPQLDPTSGDGTEVSSGIDTPDGGGTETGDSSGAQTAAPSNGLARSQQKGAVAVSWTIQGVRILALTPIMFLVWAITISEDLLLEQPGLWARGIILIGPMAASVLLDAVFQLLPPQFHWRVNVVAWMLSWLPSTKYSSAAHGPGYASKDMDVSGAGTASRRVMDETAIEDLPEWRVALFYYLLMLLPYLMIVFLWNFRCRFLSPIMRWFGSEWPSVDAQGRAQQQRTASQTARTPQLQPSEVSAVIARVSALGPFLTSVHRRFGRSSEKQPHQAAASPPPEPDKDALIDLTRQAGTEDVRGPIQGYYIDDSDHHGPFDQHPSSRDASKEKMSSAGTLDKDPLKPLPEDSETPGIALRGERAISATADHIVRLRAKHHRTGEAEAEMARSLITFSHQFSEAGKDPEALVALEESVKMYRVLYQTRGMAYATLLTAALEGYSSILSKTGKHEEALAAIEESVKMYRDLHLARPTAYAAGLATVLHSYSSILSKTGKHEGAQIAIEESVKMYRDLHLARPTAYALDLAAALRTCSSLLSKTGEREGALAAIAESLKMCKKQHQAHPTAHEADLALTLLQFSIRLGEAGSLKKAVAASEESVTRYKTLDQVRPLAYEADLALALLTYATQLSDAGRNPEAIQAATDSCVIYRRLNSRRGGALLPECAVAEGLRHEIVRRELQLRRPPLQSWWKAIRKRVVNSS